MNMTSPTHETIARRAREIWNDLGSPSGRDATIWLEAERELAALSAEEDPAAEPAHGNEAPAPSPAAGAAQAARQKRAARAPRYPTGRSAPKPEPAVTGKPLWSKPHSS